MTTVLWQSSCQPQAHLRHVSHPTAFLRRAFSVSAHRRALALIQAVNFQKQRNMVANYKVLQWNEPPDWRMTRDFMENYKIDTLTVFPGSVKQKLVRPVKAKKGLAKARRASRIMNPLERLTRWEVTGNTDENMPEPVPHPDEKVVLKNTNLYEALKYVRPGHFLIPSEALPAKLQNLPNGRISSFDIIPARQQKLTIVNIARFSFTPTHPREHTQHIFNVIWTHLLKNSYVTCQFSFRPKSRPDGYDFDWIWENCVHLRPEVVQRALPLSIRLALGPLRNGNEVTWLVVPRSNPISYRARWASRQEEQESLLKMGRGMLPKAERRALKKEVKQQLTALKLKPNSTINVSPMAMSVARLGIQRRIDLLMFKYEKLFNRLRYYLGSTYGRDRFMARTELDTVGKIAHMKSVKYLKFTPKPLQKRRIRGAKLEAADDSHRGLSKDEIIPLRRERANLDRSANECAKLEAARKDLPPWQIRTHSKTGPRSTTAKHEKEVCAEDKIETLKMEAQKHWGEDEPFNSLPNHEVVNPNEPSFNLTRSPDVVKSAKSTRTGLLSFISKVEIADREELPIRKHNSDQAPTPIRTDDQISKMNYSRCSTGRSINNAVPFDDQSNRKPAIALRMDYSLSNNEYQRAPRSDKSSELPGESPMFQAGEQQDDLRSRTSKDGRYAATLLSSPRQEQSDLKTRSDAATPSSNEIWTSHHETSSFQKPNIAPYPPVTVIGADIILGDKNQRGFKRLDLRTHTSSPRNDAGAPPKKPPKKRRVVDEFESHTAGPVQGTDSQKRMLLKAFKMDFDVSKND